MRSVDLRSENRYRLLAGLRRHGACTRAALGKLTGLSAAAVSTLTTGLADEAIVLTSSRAAGLPQRRGRPEGEICLAADAALVATVSLTIDLLRISLVRYDGTRLDVCETPLDTRRSSAKSLLTLVIDRIDALLPRDQADRLMQISIGFQGMTEHVEGTLRWSPILRARNVPVRTVLGRHFQVPVNVYDDCRLIAMALHHQQRGELGSNFVTLLFSHGIGMGLYIDGKPFSGVQTSGMEVGHLNHQRNGALCRCGLLGCIEAYAADYGILRRASGQAVSVEPIGRVDRQQFRTLIAEARRGKTRPMQAFAEAGAAIGEGLGTVFRLLDPMPVAMVGHVTAGFELMRESLQGTLEQALDDSYPLEHRVHCFDDEAPLMEAGLALDALASVDRRLAAGEQALLTDPA